MNGTQWLIVALAFGFYPPLGIVLLYIFACASEW